MAIHEVINSNKEQEHFDQDYAFYTFPRIQYCVTPSHQHFEAKIVEQDQYVHGTTTLFSNLLRITLNT
jgi:hypothetical protein